MPVSCQRSLFFFFNLIFIWAEHQQVFFVISGGLRATSVRCHMSQLLLFGQVPFRAMRRSLSCLPNLRLSGRDARYLWAIGTRYLIDIHSILYECIKCTFVDVTNGQKQQSKNRSILGLKSPQIQDAEGTSLREIHLPIHQAAEVRSSELAERLAAQVWSGKMGVTHSENGMGLIIKYSKLEGK